MSSTLGSSTSTCKFQSSGIKYFSSTPKTCTWQVQVLEYLNPTLMITNIYMSQFDLFIYPGAVYHIGCATGVQIGDRNVMIVNQRAAPRTCKKAGHKEAELNRKGIHCVYIIYHRI